MLSNSIIIRRITAGMLAALLLALGCVTAFAQEETEELQVPQLRVVTEDGNGVSLQKDDGYVDAEITITDTDGSVLQSEVSFKVRGNTTALSWVLKKPYTFKFEKKTNVLGMGKGKKWALIANAFDPTMLRNAIAFAAADELELAYTSRQQFVELWVDGSYRGLYGLYEPVQEGKDRVDIDIDSDDGKKDFLLEYEASRVEDDVTYMTVSGRRFIISEPEEPEDDQIDYIKGVMTRIVTTMKNGSRSEIAAAIDVDSFAKFYLLNEYLKTFDFSMSSVFFYYKDGKLYAGPPWDYDLSAGNEDPAYSSRAKAASETDGLFANDKNLYSFLCSKRWFMAEVRRVYREHEAFFASVGADGGLADTLRGTYGNLIEKNYTEAGWNIGKWWINNVKKPLPTYDENFAYLKTWYSERHAWLSDYFELSDAPQETGDVNGDGVVDVTDATHVQLCAANLAAPGFEAFTAADVNTDGEVDVTDGTLIQMYAAGLLTDFS